MHQHRCSNGLFCVSGAFRTNAGFSFSSYTFGSACCELMQYCIEHRGGAFHEHRGGAFFEHREGAFLEHRGGAFFEHREGASFEHREGAFFHNASITIRDRVTAKISLRNAGTTIHAAAPMISSQMRRIVMQLCISNIVEEHSSNIVKEHFSNIVVEHSPNIVKE